MGGSLWARNCTRTSALGVLLGSALGVTPGSIGAGWAAATPGQRTLTLQRAACVRGCSAFTITVHEAGSIELAGIPTSTSFEADPHAVDAVFQQVDELHFTELDRAYGLVRSSCIDFNAEQPMAALVLRDGPRSKRVQHHTGCRGPGAPDGLARLESLVLATLPAEQRTVLEHPPFEAETTALGLPPQSGSAPQTPVVSPSDERAADLLRRFEEAYGSCSPDQLASVVEMDELTRRYFEDNCSRCGGFEISTEPSGWEERGLSVWLRFHQAVRCRLSGTRTEMDLAAELVRSEGSPWRIRQIERLR